MRKEYRDEKGSSKSFSNQSKTTQKKFAVLGEIWRYFTQNVDQFKTN